MSRIGNVNGDRTYTEYTGDAPVFVPDVEIKQDDPSYVYAAQRGYSGTLAVFNLEDECIGWIDTRTLGFETARAWMDARTSGPTFRRGLL